MVCQTKKVATECTRKFKWCGLSYVNVCVCVIIIYPFNSVVYSSCFTASLEFIVCVCAWNARASSFHCMQNIRLWEMKTSYVGWCQAFLLGVCRFSILLRMLFLFSLTLLTNTLYFIFYVLSFFFLSLSLFLSSSLPLLQI